MDLRKTVCSALLCLISLLSALSPARAAEQRVFDEANLFSASEEAELSTAIVRFQQETGMDFVILTSREALGSKSAEAVADDYYDYGGFGLDQENSGVLFYINMYERYQHLSTTGLMIDYMADERIESAIEASTPSLSAGRYYAAAATMLSKVEGYYEAGIPQGQFRYDVITGERLTARHRSLTPEDLLISAAVALVCGLVCVLVIQRRYRLKGSTYRYQYRSNCDIVMTHTDDTFLRTTTTRTRKPQHSGGGGSGGGGFSGGSGTHSGSSGTSHGGGGGRF